MREVRVRVPSIRDIGKGIAHIAKHGYEGSIRIPSVQEAVDATCRGVDAASRVRLRMKPKGE